MSAKRRRRIKAFSILRTFALLFVWGLSLVAAIAYATIMRINADLPKDLAQLTEYQPSRKSLVFSADGEEIGTFAVENRKFVHLDRMPPHLLAAFVSAEDRRFWEHPGFDIIGIARAAWANVGASGGAIKQGGSTIPQQIVKQTLLAGEEDIDTEGMTDDQAKKAKKHAKYLRKMKELVLSARLSRELSKAEVLEIYLNHVYLGHGAYGVGAAAETYFGKDVENLTISEAALLAGLVASPSKYAPTTNLELARERQQYVLGAMRDEKYITDTEYAAALVEPIALVDTADLNHLAAPYFVEHVRRLATQRYGDSELFRGGLVFTSTLDTRMQAAAETALRHGLESLDRKLGFRGPIGAVAAKNRKEYADGPAHRYRPGAPEGDIATGDKILPDVTYAAMISALPRGGGVELDLGPLELPLAIADAPDVRAWHDKKTGKPVAVGDLLPVRVALDGKAAVLAQPPALQGALVALEPSTGRVVALVGGYDWVSSQYDRATQAKRQIGSAIKPFIYAAALAHGHTSVDSLYDAPVFVPTATGIWSPSNYGNIYMGRVTLRTAIAFSLNTISVQLLSEVGVDRLIDELRGFGITSPIPRHISIALGTPDLTLLEIAGGYAGLASGGRKVEPRFYDMVTDANGVIIDDLRARPPGPQILSPDIAYTIVDMMKGPIQRGTARRAADFPRPAAGKTGTSNNYKDVWFLGFTTDLLCGVWIGRDDSTPIGDKITGGGAAVPIWLDFMKNAHPPTPPRDFPVPPGITFVRADEWSGDPAGPGQGALIPFARGALPARFAGGVRAAGSFEDLVPAPPVP